MIVFASQFLPTAEELHDGGGIRVVGGKIVGAYRSLAAVRRAGRASSERVLDLGEGVLAPGLVDAHAHLDLTGLGGRLDGAGGFVPWIGALLKQRGPLRRPDFERAVQEGARRLLRTGTTTVGDIDSSGCGTSARRVGLRTVVYRELLDAWDPARTRAALDRISRPLRGHALVTEGVSPHAPYTTSAELLAGISRTAKQRRLPVAVHWSETSEEVQWLSEGRGPFGQVLPAVPRCRGLELLERAGLLRPRTTLIHGNHPARGEPARLAESGVCLVHCPGTHAFFDRPPFPWKRYARAGVRLALGTDSLASNGELDMRREMSLAIEAWPGLTPERAWRMGTQDAACAVGLGGAVGALLRGRCADFVLYEGLGARARKPLLEALVRGAGRVGAVRVGGRSIRLSRS